jgi:hypothetical protein
MYILTSDYVRPVLSSQRATHKDRTATVNQYQHLVMNPMADRKSQRDFDLIGVSGKQLHQHSGPVNLNDENVSSRENRSSSAPGNIHVALSRTNDHATFPLAGKRPECKQPYLEIESCNTTAHDWAINGNLSTLISAHALWISFYNIHHGGNYTQYWEE